ncbi:hypothetical protein HU200_035937 [Digitaria exilis]|uniref:Uncharacterized protein n=1 Tax=Digitaria exilis TaxID=1010633 RepID=A0A835EP15_9POAL|nr:hypothetical protein HU200_035937 [Digitaria exilis]
MAKPHPTSASKHRPPTTTMASSSPVLLLHAAWIAAIVAVSVALCTIHSRKPSSSSRRRAASRSASSSSNRRGSSMESIMGGTAAGGSTPAKVSSTPGDTANGAVEAADSSGSPVTVIEVGTHGPIPPAFVLPPPPDPVPPRRSLSLSLSAKHIRFAAAERLGRIRSMQRGGGEGGASTTGAEDDVFVGCRRGGGGEVGEEGTLWTKTIILGERCGVPTDDGDDGDGGGGGDEASGTTVRWKSYRPRQQRSLPVTRSNSFAGVGSAGARRLADPRF